jgi:hypothetical protein
MFPFSSQNLRNVYGFLEGVTSEYFGIPDSKFYKLKEATYRKSF